MSWMMMNGKRMLPYLISCSHGRKNYAMKSRCLRLSKRHINES
uniref:Uncharacterized protein n=1 Tax=Arundo donax TaxID=35708 RepID=A0A0A9BA48_ARUDO